MSFPTILNASCFDLGRHCNLNGIALYKLLRRPFSPDVFIFSEVLRILLFGKLKFISKFSSFKWSDKPYGHVPMLG